MNKLEGKELTNYYLNKIEEYQLKSPKAEKWKTFKEKSTGISEENLKQLKEEYPLIPESLIDILKVIDGTYHEKIEDHSYSFYMFSSDIDEGEYPYYLLSSKKILETKEEYKYFDFMITREFDLYVDDKISNNLDNIKWLHFADCMNNGGTSQLFIDFTPSDTGKVGQIIRTLHDTDEIRVIADDFDEFLNKIIENDFKFLK